MTWKVDGIVIPADGDVLEYRFTPPSQYIVELIAKTSTGCTSTFTDTIRSFQQCDLHLNFKYQEDPSNARSILFEPDPYDSSLTYSFATGSGGTTSSHYMTFPEPGPCAVTMLATDSLHHCYDTTSRVINVRGNVYDSCTAGLNTIQQSSLEYLFTPVSNQPVIHQYLHIYNPGGIYDSVAIASGQSATYTFRDTGYFFIVLRLTTQTGCAKYAYDTVHVSNSPVNSPRLVNSYPNPASHEISIHVNTELPATAFITVLNASGRPVYKTKVPTTKGINHIVIPVQSLQKGQYYINIQYGSQYSKSTFLKL